MCPNTMSFSPTWALFVFQNQMYNNYLGPHLKAGMLHGSYTGQGGGGGSSKIPGGLRTP